MHSNRACRSWGERPLSYWLGDTPPCCGRRLEDRSQLLCLPRHWSFAYVSGPYSQAGKSRDRRRLRLHLPPARRAVCPVQQEVSTDPPWLQAKTRSKMHKEGFASERWIPDASCFSSNREDRPTASVEDATK